MGLSRTEIREIISAHCWERGYGRGYSYHPYLNGEKVGRYTPPSLMEQLKKKAQEGDYVIVDVYSSRGQHYVGDFEFTIESSPVVEQYRAYKERHNYKKTTDYQRQAVYNWEGRTLRQNKDLQPSRLLTLEEAEGIVNEVYSLLGIDHVHPPSLVINNRLRRYSYARYWNRTLQLHKDWGLRLHVVLHELAHFLKRDLSFVGSSHGAEFVSLNAFLMALYIGVSEEEALAEADVMGVDYIENFDITNHLTSAT